MRDIKANARTEEKDDKIKFPKITIDLAVKYIEMIVNSEKGDIISFDDIGNAIRKKGGNLNRIVKSLREYSLIEKSGVSAWRITELGKSIAMNKNPNEIFKAFTSSPINSRLWGQFTGKRPSPDVLVRFIETSEHIKDKASRKLAKLFLKNYDYLTASSIIGERTGETPTIPPKETKEGVGSETYKMILLVNQIFPAERKEDIVKILDELVKLTDKKGLLKFSGFIENLKISIGDKDEKEIADELRKVSARALEIFKSELKLEKSKT